MTRTLLAVAAVLVWIGVGVAADRPAIKSIGIVSDVGDKVSINHVGIMVFTNSVVVQDVPDWAIDAHITGTLGDALQGRYAIKAVDYPRGQIAPSIGAFLNDPKPDDNMRTKVKPKDGAPVDASSCGRCAIPRLRRTRRSRALAW